MILFLIYQSVLRISHALVLIRREVSVRQERRVLGATTESRQVKWTWFGVANSLRCWKSVLHSIVRSFFGQAHPREGAPSNWIGVFRWDLSSYPIPGPQLPFPYPIPDRRPKLAIPSYLSLCNPLAIMLNKPEINYIPYHRLNNDL